MANYGGTITQQARQDTAMGVPIGMIFAWPAPVGTALPDGYLLCDGNAILRSTYPELFAAASTMYGDGTTKPSGASWISSGFAVNTAFNLPDLRGTFIRGTDNTGGTPGTAGRDPGGRVAQTTGANSGTSIGSVQSDAIQGHAHEGWGTGTETGGTGGPLYLAGAHNFGNMMRNPQADISGNGAPRVAGETRPVSMTCQFIIRAY